LKPSVRKVSARGRLAREAFAGGGVPLSEAVSRAEAAAAPAMAACRDAFDQALKDLLDRFNARPGDEGESFESLYDLAERLIELSDAETSAELIQVARSLCDVADACAMQGAWDWAAVQVHLSALALLSSGAEPSRQEGAALLNGLAKVRRRLGR